MMTTDRAGDDVGSAQLPNTGSFSAKSKNNKIFWEDDFTQLAFAAFAKNQPSVDTTMSMSRLNGKWSSSIRKTEMRIVCSRFGESLLQGSSARQ